MKQNKMESLNLTFNIYEKFTSPQKPSLNLKLNVVGRIIGVFLQLDRVRIEVDLGEKGGRGDREVGRAGAIKQFKTKPMKIKIYVGKKG